MCKNVLVADPSTCAWVQSADYNLHKIAMLEMPHILDVSPLHLHLTVSIQQTLSKKLSQYTISKHTAAVIVLTVHVISDTI